MAGRHGSAGSVSQRSHRRGERPLAWHRAAINTERPVHVQVLRQAFEEEEFDGEELRSITKKALRKMLGRTPGLEAAGQTEALAEAVLQEREALIAQQQPPPPRQQQQQQQQSAASAAAEEEEGVLMVCPPSAH
jgi:hypothetical protein